MATFKRFEEIQAWQKARVTAKEIYISSSKGEFSKDYDLRSQIRRSAVSIISPRVKEEEPIKISQIF